MPQEQEKELTITRIYKQPREFVFRGWTDPRLFAKWWGPEGFTNSACELDVRPGGTIRLDMTAPDGTVYPFRGEYNEIVEPEKLVFTGGSFLDGSGRPQLESRTTVLFDEYEGKTKLTVHTAVTHAASGLEQPLSGMEEGWMTSLDRLERALS
ncbi:SRPBCC family protein [Cohnella caldifontis]|uniref:SRPBCC family protein n=1 Tax=Cohnella caldifontis TaxID=3027471 RepID=UPI0023EAAC8E|nr:SRPBCC domain-containing protein [Cohnella sp. YIM B05605]